jgi:hypothetical protein
VKLVNLRAGQDSGYFSLEESVAALTYAGDPGIGRGRHEPRLPAGAERENRRVSPSCLTMPNEGNGVLTISALAPSKRKAYYSATATARQTCRPPAATSTTALPTTSRSTGSRTRRASWRWPSPASASGAAANSA